MVTTARMANGGRTRLAELVAQRAGVSLMTVSRVFNNSPRVAEATRERVLDAARAVGYEPSSAARSLRRGRSNLIGFLLESTMGIRGHFHADTLAALEAVVAAEGYMVSLVAPARDQTLLSTVRMMIAARSCAAYVARFDHFNEAELASLLSAGVPLIVAGAAAGNYSAVSSVSFDNARGCVQAVRHLYRLGHRRIAHLAGDTGLIDAAQREEGFRRGMAEVGLNVEQRLVRACQFGNAMATAGAAMDDILASGGPPPTAVVCASDELAAGAIAATRRWGYSVPGDMSFVGFDDAYWCRFLTPPLTTVRHDGLELGTRLGEVLLEQLAGRGAQPRKEVLATALVVRESTAPPRSTG
jgi:LacI family transcriptional regulator